MVFLIHTEIREVSFDITNGCRGPFTHTAHGFIVPYTRAPNAKGTDVNKPQLPRCKCWKFNGENKGGEKPYDEPVTSGMFENVLHTEKCGTLTDVVITSVSTNEGSFMLWEQLSSDLADLN